MNIFKLERENQRLKEQIVQLQDKVDEIILHLNNFLETSLTDQTIIKVMCFQKGEMACTQKIEVMKRQQKRSVLSF